MSVSNLSGARWFAVNTHPRAEGRATENLQRQGFVHFYPFVTKSFRSGRRSYTGVGPLFPGYIFVQLDPERAPWRAVESTFGVRAIVKAGGSPTAMPGGVVDELINMSDDNGLFSFGAHLSEGDDVRILAGPFAGLVGTLESMDGQGRIIVLLNLLGRAARMKAMASDVSPIN
jgi:transcriptional antiterminator RfaH